MWFFKCPEFFFGEDALSQLEMLPGKRAFIVTDANIAKLGFADLVQQTLAIADIDEAMADPEGGRFLRDASGRLNGRGEEYADWLTGRLTDRFGISDENNALKLGYDPLARHWPDWLRLPRNRQRRRRW